MASHTSRRDFLKSAVIAGCGSAMMPFLSLKCGRTRDIVQTRPREFDIIIKGGNVIDGLGTPTEVVDIGIIGDKIAAVGNLQDNPARRILYVQGLTVAPGFIDIHAHTNLLRNPKAESKIFQGVTLDITGPCGGSDFPRRTSRPQTGEEQLISDISECTNFEEWAVRQRENPAAMNIGSHIGHETVRGLVLGSTLREPNPNELRLMQDIVAQALDQGALAFSTGLEYGGGRAKPAEIEALCKVVADKGKFYATHMRSEDEFVEEAVEEAIQVARKTGVSLQISHMKLSGKPNWHKIDNIINMIEKARNDGFNVNCDRYPYLAWSTGMSLFFPQWAKEGGRLRERLSNPAERERMKKETLSKVENNGGWEAIMIKGGVSQENRDIIGRRVDEIARERGEDPYELVCDLLSGASVIGFSMSEENTERIISLPYCMIGSDGGATSPRPEGGGHPRSFGAFPRAIRKYVHERKIMPLHEMVRKITSLPAEKIGILDRGRIRENAYADIVVFNPETFTDNATYLEPNKLASGVSYLLVNGQLVIDNATQTDTLPGRVITK